MRESNIAARGCDRFSSAVDWALLERLAAGLSFTLAVSWLEATSSISGGPPWSACPGSHPFFSPNRVPQSSRMSQLIGTRLEGGNTAREYSRVGGCTGGYCSRNCIRQTKRVLSSLMDFQPLSEGPKPTAYVNQEENAWPLKKCGAADAEEARGPRKRTCRCLIAWLLSPYALTSYWPTVPQSNLGQKGR